MSVPFQLALGNNVPLTVSTGQGRIDMPDPTYLDIGGGLSGQVMTTAGGATKNLYWASVTATGADAPSDTFAYGRLNGTWSRVVNRLGDTMMGLLSLSADPTLPLHAATKQYVDNRPTDAPNDGSAYGRQSAAWAKVLPLTGGTLLGLLTLSGPPINPLHAATKAYVDGRSTSVDGVSILGDGIATPLRVGAIDCGTY